MRHQSKQRDNARDLRVCVCAPGGTVNVQGPDYGRTFAAGAEVDFAERVAPHVPVTWGQALERYTDLFVSPQHQAAPIAVEPQNPVVSED